MSRPHRIRTAPSGTAVAYVRVSTADQAENGVGLDVQRVAIAEYAQRHGLTVVAEYADEGISGSKGIDQRPGLAAAVEAVENGSAAALIVAKMDRLSRSLVDTATLIQRAECNRWALVMVDFDIDMRTPAGEFSAHVLAASNHMVRRLIAERTRAALAVKKAQGVRLGRPSTIPTGVTARIVADRKSGMTLQAISDALNDECVPTARGGSMWRPSTVKAVLISQDAAKIR
ncbi:MAG: recombinase family protein [Nocardiaceae bacterium]|nr:recombinase family protein [Nocardiaceae bacterium]